MGRNHDRWYVFVDDPQDPALREFAFPDVAYEGLSSSSTGLLAIAAVEGKSSPFFDRLRDFIGDVRRARTSHEEERVDGRVENQAH